jgi:hypothetical protein
MIGSSSSASPETVKGSRTSFPHVNKRVVAAPLLVHVIAPDHTAEAGPGA